MKKKKKISIIDKILITFIIVGILGIVNIEFSKQQFLNILINYTQNEANKFINLITTNSFNNEVNKIASNDDLYTCIYNNDENLEMLNFNFKNISNIQNNIINKINDSFSNFDCNGINNNLDIFSFKKNINNNGIYFMVPFGIINNNPFFSFFGPEIPITFKYISNINVISKYAINDYSINTISIEISLDIIIDLMILIPYINNMFRVKNTFPLIMSVIQGKVPNTFVGSSEIVSSSKGGIN